MGTAVMGKQTVGGQGLIATVWRRLFCGPMSRLERLGMAAMGVAVLTALILPIWWIYLWAPQYPEGLRVFIHARDLTGNVQGVNILNHYIGMKPLGVEMFPEFKWMSWVLGALGGTLLVVAAIGRRELILAGWLCVVGFDLFMLWDLWHWLYDWGHDLDPRAAMTIAPFTPPVLGFRQIANFVVYSLPSWGGLGVMLATMGVPLWAAWHFFRSWRHS